LAEKLTEKGLKYLFFEADLNGIIYRDLFQVFHMHFYNVPIFAGVNHVRIFGFGFGNNIGDSFIKSCSDL
jgi:hypothetical protein